MFDVKPVAVCLVFAQAAFAGEPGKGTLKGKVTVEGDAARPWVVYVEKVAAAPAAPAAKEPPMMVQKGIAFQPGALVVGKGHEVEFPNKDKAYHNVFSRTPGNEFDLGLYREGTSRTVEMRAAGEVDVYCNIHPNMAAKILVVQNPYYAEVADDGSYVIRDVPPGAYTLVAWSSTHEPVKKPVEVAAGATLAADFALKPRKGTGAHLNKSGEQYGRYK